MSKVVNNLRWTLVCARHAYRAACRDRIVVPVAFPAPVALQLTGEGLLLAAPMNRLTVERDPDTDTLTLYGHTAALEEIVADPQVAGTLARSLDLLQACEAVRDDLPPIVKQAARKLHQAVRVQNRQALKRLSA